MYWEGGPTTVVKTSKARGDRPLKFVRTMLTFGDYYEMVNDYASIEQVFSRSNFIRTTEYGISQRQELINGLFAEASFTFEDQQALVGLQLADWSSELFGDLNTPLDFARYKKSEFRLRMQYNMRQRYEIKRGRKLILGSDYPELYLEYRKGVPGLFGSEVNFDYLEIGFAGWIWCATDPRAGKCKWAPISTRPTFGYWSTSISGVRTSISSRTRCAVSSCLGPP